MLTVALLVTSSCPQDALWATTLSPPLPLLHFNTTVSPTPNSHNQFLASTFLYWQYRHVCHLDRASCMFLPLAAYHSGGMVSMAGQFVWDLWWMMCQRGRWFSQYTNLLRQLSFHQFFLRILPSVPSTLYSLDEGCPGCSRRRCVTRPSSHICKLHAYCKTKQ
jgi:hypothetical protein